jgi:hypothetical protein
MTKAASCVAGLLLIAAGAASAGRETWTRTSDVGPDPVTETKRESLDFSPTGRIDVSSLSGSVEVTGSKGNKVELTYERRAATQQDLDCEKLVLDQSADRLRIRLERKREKECRVIRASDKLVLSVPRKVAFSAESIGDSVKVTGVEGVVHLSSIGDSVILEGVQQVVASSIGDTMKLDVDKLGPEGIRIDSVGDSVELSLPKKLDARLRIHGVGDSIRGPGLRREHGEHDNDSYEAVIGKGGPMIRITSVGDSVEIRGPDLGRRSHGEEL